MTTLIKAGLVEGIMSNPVVTIQMDDSLHVVKGIFDSVKFRHLLVVSSDKLVGVLSDRDYLKTISPTVGTISENRADIELLNRRAHQVMSRDPITLGPNNTIEDAISIFNAKNFSCIPIVNAENEPVGIVSWRDILRCIAADAAEAA